MNEKEKTLLTISLALTIATPFSAFAVDELSEFLAEDPDSPLAVEGVGVQLNPAADLNTVGSLIEKLDGFAEKTPAEARMWGAARLQLAHLLHVIVGEEKGSKAPLEDLPMVQAVETAIARFQEELPEEKIQAKQRRPNVRRIGEPRPEPEVPSAKTPRFAGSALHRTRLRGAVRRIR